LIEANALTTTLRHKEAEKVAAVYIFDSRSEHLLFRTVDRQSPEVTHPKNHWNFPKCHTDVSLISSERGGGSCA